MSSFAKIGSVKQGDKLVPDGGFTCMKSGRVKTVEEDDLGLFVRCKAGTTLMAKKTATCMRA